MREALYDEAYAYEMENNADMDNIYELIHSSIENFPHRNTDYYANKLKISSSDFYNIARLINRWPNSFWPFGPFKHDNRGWCIDSLTPRQENIILLKKIATLESKMEKLRDLNKPNTQ